MPHAIGHAVTQPVAHARCHSMPMCHVLCHGRCRAIRHARCGAIVHGAVRVARRVRLQLARV
eukprot:3637641-Lingulodinium_polyedra.AAC.1